MAGAFFEVFLRVCCQNIEANLLNVMTKVVEGAVCFSSLQATRSAGHAKRLRLAGSPGAWPHQAFEALGWSLAWAVRF